LGAEPSRRFGVHKITLTLIYAVYVIGNLTALIFFGRLSDEIGRRRTVLAAIGIAAVSTLFFLFARDTSWLFWGRIFSGLAVGLASGAATAWIAELDLQTDKARATLVATGANFTALAVGSLLAGTLAQYAPRPLALPFVVYLAALAVMAIFVSRTRETVARLIQRLRDIDIAVKPTVGLPREMRAQFVAPAFTAFGTFALIGFYAALAPSVMIESLRVTNRAIQGGIVFELALIAAVTVIVARRLTSRTAMLTGLALLPVSLGLLVFAQTSGSMPTLLVGTALSGVAGALGYRGSLQVVNQIAPADRRAEVVSSYFLVCFFGNSVPVIGVGVLSTLMSSKVASGVFAVTIGLFALAAMLAAAKSERTPEGKT
jgi:MFS family permease